MNKFELIGMKIIVFLLLCLSHFFAKANHGMLPKSKEIITMELQNELKLPLCRGCFVYRSVFLELDGVTKVFQGILRKQ
jgi:hypothetical protein